MPKYICSILGVIGVSLIITGCQSTPEQPAPVVAGTVTADSAFVAGQPVVAGQPAVAGQPVVAGQPASPSGADATAPANGQAMPVQVVLPPPRPAVNRIIDTRVEIGKDLSETLKVQEVNVSMTNDGYLRAQVVITNLEDKPFKVIYQFNWYDENDSRVANPDHEGWERKYLLSEDDLTLTSTAPTRACKNFKLRFRGR